ncbi:hypothetical protein [Actinophytocola sp. NPDC049390]|uniref:hypothetical protein n=1 Tax=Actinophytocola sp. NPDC049390 TaxID=3363894 RepID=UPI0037BA4093
MTVPEGAQLSEDGRYWWDGADWQPVPDGETQQAEVGALSDDGKWKWDGSQWQPVDDGAGADALVGALAGAGIDIAPEVADAGYIQQVAAHVNSWYEGLDETSRAIVDALSRQGADTLLGDPEVGVVSEGDPLITAFAGNGMSLGESLQATNQALEQTA